MSVETRFEQRLRQVARQCAEECDYRPMYFLRMLDERGGIATAKALLAKPLPSEGFHTLFEKRRLDLTVEHVVLEEDWDGAFTPAERRKAARWLGR